MIRSLSPNGNGREPVPIFHFSPVGREDASGHWVSREELLESIRRVNVLSRDVCRHVRPWPAVPLALDGVEDHVSTLPALAPCLAGDLAFLIGYAGRRITPIASGPSGGPIPN